MSDGRCQKVDLILANGHPDDMIEKYSAQVHYLEPLVLFHQEQRKLRNVTADVGAAFTKSYPAGFSGWRFE